MHSTPASLPIQEAPPVESAQRQKRRVIYIACPWTPVGGGMFKVADYLVHAQAQGNTAAGARLLPLDTRGAGSAAASLVVLAGALARLAWGRLRGEVAGVHVNVAERLSLVRKSVLIATCRALGLPVVLHLHAAQLHRAWPGLPGPVRSLVRWVFSLPQCCIVLGQASARFMSQELGVPRERIKVVVNGVPAPTLPRNLRSDGLNLLFVGNLSARKGVPELLRAMNLPSLAKLPVTLTLAGGGSLEPWRAMAKELGVARRVRFEGWTDAPRLAQLMAQADALVLPSRDEGLPLAILEALAQGVPVVCTPVGEIPHQLVGDTHAVFVPPGDAHALAIGLARVLGDARLRETLSRNGHELWRRRFSLRPFFFEVAAVHARYFGLAASPSISTTQATQP